MASPSKSTDSKPLLTGKDMEEIDQVFESLPLHETYTTDQAVDWLLDVLDLTRVEEADGDEVVDLAGDDAVPKSPRRVRQQVADLAGELQDTSIDEETDAVLSMFAKRFNNNTQHLFCKDGLLFWAPAASNPHVDYFEGPTLVEKLNAVQLPEDFVYITPYCTTVDDESVVVNEFKVWGTVPWSEVETFLDSPDFRDVMKDLILEKRHGSRAIDIDKVAELYDKNNSEE